MIQERQYVVELIEGGYLRRRYPTLNYTVKLEEALRMNLAEAYTVAGLDKYPDPKGSWLPASFTTTRWQSLLFYVMSTGFEFRYFPEHRRMRRSGNGFSQ